MVMTSSHGRVLIETETANGDQMEVVPFIQK